MHGHDKPGHVPDREEAVGGRKVHEVDPRPRDSQPHRDHVAPATAALRACRPARCFAHVDDQSLKRGGNLDHCRRWSVYEDRELMAPRLFRQRAQKLPGEAAEAAPIREATSIYANFHERSLMWMTRGQHLGGYFDRACQRETRLAHRATAGLGNEAVPRSVLVPGAVETDPWSGFFVYQ